MKELVIKRQANVTSADALDEINAAYPHAEVLSFRRIRDAASEADLFVTRIRVAADMFDESTPEESLPEEDVVVEGKQHEDEEEAMMKDMLDLLRQIKDIVSDEEAEDVESEEPERIETEEEIERKHKAKPLPEPSEPPFAAAGVGQMTPVASVVAQRPATISKTAARLELIREFSNDYVIGEIEKRDGVFVASLTKKSEIDTENMADPKQKGILEMMGVEPTEDSKDETSSESPDEEYDDVNRTGISFMDPLSPWVRWKEYKKNQKPGDLSRFKDYVHPTRLDEQIKEKQDAALKAMEERGEDVPSKKDQARERSEARPQPLRLTRNQT